MLGKVFIYYFSVSFKSRELFFTASSRVMHMEHDRYLPGKNILIGCLDNLQTTNGSHSTILLKQKMSSFTQLNRTHVIIVDYENHCLRGLDRERNQTFVLAGECGTSGYVDGPLGVGLLNRPWSVERNIYKPHTLLVTDSYNQALRSVDLNIGVLSTVVRSGLAYPKGMKFTGRELLVANSNHYISFITWSKYGIPEHSVLAGTNRSGNVYGSFNNARFYKPSEIEKIANNMYLLSESGGNSLKFINLNRQVVGPVCFAGESTCNESSVFPNFGSFDSLPLLRVGQDVYAGVNRTIHKLIGRYNLSLL